MLIYWNSTADRLASDMASGHDIPFVVAQARLQAKSADQKLEKRFVAILESIVADKPPWERVIKQCKHVLPRVRCETAAVARGHDLLQE